MKMTKLALPFFATLLGSGAAFAGADSGIYIGGSLGSAQLEYSPSQQDLQDYVSDIDLSTFGDISFDDDDTGYKIFAGYNLGLVPFLDLAVEGSYVNFGSVGGGGLEVDADGWAGFGLVGFKLGPVGLFGKVGAFIWDYEVDFSGVDTSFSESEDGTDPAYGLGARFQIGSFAIRAEYEIFDLGDVDIDLYSIGGSYTF